MLNSRPKARGKMGQVVVMAVLPPVVVVVVAMAVPIAGSRSTTASAVLLIDINLSVAMAMAVAVAALTVDAILHVAEVVHGAGDDDGALLLESVLLLRRLQELHEERMVEVYHRHQNALLQLPFRPHPYRQASLGRLLLVVAAADEVWHVELEAKRPPKIVVVLMAVLLLLFLVLHHVFTRCDYFSN